MDFLICENCECSYLPEHSSAIHPAEYCCLRCEKYSNDQSNEN